LRLGVLGGSFNPPHIGHLLVAGDAYEALHLDRLLIVTAWANPLKAFDDSSPAPQQRLEMVRLAFGADPRFEVSSVEIDRGGLSYTVDTLEALTTLHPGAELIFLIGSDSLRTMDDWKRPGRIRELARLAVLTRLEEEGSPVSAGHSDPVALPEDASVVTTRRIDISSSEIRARVAAGKSIRGFVAESVEKYISAAKLYRTDQTDFADRADRPRNAKVRRPRGK